MHKKNLPPYMASFFIWLEKYIISVLFLLFSYSHLVQLVAHDYSSAINQDPLTTETNITFVINQTLLMVFCFVAGFFMLINQRPKKLPESWIEVLIPLAGTFFALGYNFSDYLPEFLSQNYAPTGNLAFIITALALSIFGYSFSIWGVTSLGKSFAIMVAVRKVVSHGPYRLVRHPIYFGYLFEISGLALSHLSIFNIFITLVGILLMVLRARLEENKLARYDDGYRLYMEQTGFLFPKLNRN